MLNPNIILSGQPLNVLGAMTAGADAAAQQNQYNRQREMNALLKEQGAGILAGDQNALNALAAFDPNAALVVQESRLGMDATRLGMDATRQQMSALDAQTKRAAEEYARGLSKEQAAAEAAELEAAVKMGLAAPNAQAFDALMMQKGLQELVGQFENREALGMQFLEMADIMKMNAPPAPNERYKVVGQSLFDLGAEGGPVPVGQGAMPERTIYGPDGNPIYSEGGANPTGIKLTEGQSKDLGFYRRALGASENLDKVEGALTGLSDTTASKVPLVGNYMISDEYQVAVQAAREWLAPLLRKDTGAAVTDTEFQIYGAIYLPAPGDGKAVIEQKRKARERAVQGMRDGMGTAEIIAAEIAAQQAAGSKPPPAKADSIGPKAPVVIDGFTIEAVE